MKKFFLYKRYASFKAAVLRCVYLKKKKNLAIYDVHLNREKELAINNRASLKKIVEEQSNGDSNLNAESSSMDRIPKEELRLPSFTENEDPFGRKVLNYNFKSNKTTNGQYIV